MGHDIRYGIVYSMVYDMMHGMALCMVSCSVWYILICHGVWYDIRYVVSYGLL